LGHSFASKLGLHPLNLTGLSSITSNYEKWNLLVDYCLHMNVTVCFPYVLARHGTLGQSCACKLGLHPLNLAGLSGITINFEK
jgi:hypothetical protein